MSADPLLTVRKAADKAASASLARDEAIRAAHAAGYSIRGIASVANLSSARVHQILHGR